ncbi:hypothetical protein IJZ97_03970 [bacterium]|nr:hypothetical protein [bacterium]
MAYNQGGLNDIREISGVAQTAMSALQGAVPSYSFGDVTRVGRFEQGGQTPKNQRFNADETFADASRVGLNPFNELAKGFTFSAIG